MENSMSEQSNVFGEIGHQWVLDGTCRKKCIKCGAKKYDHDYEVKSDVTSGISGDERRDISYVCKKCGHTAVKTCGYWEDKNTRQIGIIAE